MAVTKKSAAPRSSGRPPAVRPQRHRMSRAGRAPLAMLDALIDTLVEAIDQAQVSELAALSNQLLSAMERRAALAPAPDGSVAKGRQARADRRSGAVAVGAARGGGVKRGR